LKDWRKQNWEKIKEITILSQQAEKSTTSNKLKTIFNPSNKLANIQTK
jgi:hypothetical protein